MKRSDVLKRCAPLRLVALAILSFMVSSANVGAVGPRAVGPDGEDEPVLSQYYVEAKDAVMQEIALRFDVEERDGDGFHVIVPQDRAAELLELAPDAQLEEADIREIFDRLANSFGDDYLASYRNLTEVQAYIKQIAADHPEFASVETIGTTEAGRDILALKLSDAVATDEDEPEFMITSATHGDELISVEVVLGLIEKLVQGYGTDERLSALINDRELYFVPVVNVDGFSSRSRYTRGVDPNRDYPYPSQPNRSSVDCIETMINFTAERDFVGSMDFHASGRLIMYPWAYTTSAVDAEDAATFRTVTTSMAQANRYQPGQISRILYAAPGSSADYYYWKDKTIALGIEIGTTKVPPSSEIPRHVEENAEATWRFIEQVGAE